MTFNATLGIERSYYAATANPFTHAPSLTGTVEADLCVVGGGCSGLSAALHARERGFSVVVLEGGRIGWGASGRNGGQMIPGLRKSALELIGRRRLDGLSIGFIARDWAPRTGVGRELREVELREISLVASPMLATARFGVVGGAKSRPITQIRRAA